MKNISFENALSFYTISVSFTKIFGYGLPRTLLLSGFCSTLLQWCIININSILVSDKYTVHLYLTKTDSLYIKRKMLTIMCFSFLVFIFRVTYGTLFELVEITLLRCH